MKNYNIYLCGMGGQGIGAMTNILTRACIKAGYPVLGCDTHGLAQRGGIVKSHLRLGEKIHTPLVPAGQADLVIALETLEAYRAGVEMLRHGGTVLNYQVEYQPVHVRLGLDKYPSLSDLAGLIAKKEGKLISALHEALEDERMQNIVLLAKLVEAQLIEGVTFGLIEQSIIDIMPERLLKPNLKVFHEVCGRVQ
jgi:indolepyruvate ferredoxin oxidoreductase, beta subunit